MDAVDRWFETMVAGITPQAIDSVIEYPAEYGIKVMGLAEMGFGDLIKSILLSHLDQAQAVNYSYKHSGQKKYISITCTFEAKSRLQLDQIYADLQAHPKVLMVL